MRINRSRETKESKYKGKAISAGGTIKSETVFDAVWHQRA